MALALPIPLFSPMSTLGRREQETEKLERQSGVRQGQALIGQ